jgi:hypothetical protein
MEFFGDTMIALRAIISRWQYEMFTTPQRVQRLNLARIRVDPAQPIDISRSIFADVTRQLRARLGEVSVKLEVRAVKRPAGRYDDVAENLRSEVGRIVQPEDELNQFASAEVEYDSTNAHEETANLLESRVTASVSVALAGRGVITTN